MFSRGKPQIPKNQRSAQTCVSCNLAPNQSTAECRRYITFSLFDPARTKPLEISASRQDLVKDINPANAAVLAVYPDSGPQYISAN